MEWSSLFAHLFVNAIKYIICGRSKAGEARGHNAGYPESRVLFELSDVIG